MVDGFFDPVFQWPSFFFLVFLFHLSFGFDLNFELCNLTFDHPSGYSANHTANSEDNR